MSDSEEDRQTVTLWVPQISDSLHISVDHLKSELKLVEQGRKDGQKLLPPHNQHTLNEIQLEICSRIFRGIRQLNDFLSKEVAAVAKRARAIVPVRPTIQDLKEQVGGAIEKVFIEHGDELRKTRADFLQTQRDLKAFRANNGLIQKAYYNESSVMVAATILAMFVAESVLNGTLFADVVSTGLIGGAGLAGTISAANIGFGVFAGLVGWRLAHHVSQKKRIIGYLVILIIHPAVIAGNFFVAHLREAAEALASQSNYDFNPATLGSAAMAHIHEHGFFGITSIQSL